MSPTQRSLKLLRSRGGIVGIVEKWNVYAKIRQDLFGFADLVHVHGDLVDFVQTTSGSSVSQRIGKILQNPNAIYILTRGLPSPRIIVHGWRKVGPRGKRKIWECREVQIQPQLVT